MRFMPSILTLALVLLCGCRTFVCLDTPFAAGPKDHIGGWVLPHNEGYGVEVFCTSAGYRVVLQKLLRREGSHAVWERVTELQADPIPDTYVAGHECSQAFDALVIVRSTHQGMKVLRAWQIEPEAKRFTPVDIRILNCDFTQE